MDDWNLDVATLQIIPPKTNQKYIYIYELNYKEQQFTISIEQRQSNLVTPNIIVSVVSKCVFVRFLRSGQQAIM